VNVDDLDALRRSAQHILLTANVPVEHLTGLGPLSVCRGGVAAARPGSAQFERRPGTSLVLLTQ
jgi:hypothetical protein